MNIYVISQDCNENYNYDTYDSAVVVAPSEEEARMVHPSGDGYTHAELEGEQWMWVRPAHVVVKLIGTAAAGLEAGTVICASFNAG